MAQRAFWGDSLLGRSLTRAGLGRLLGPGLQGLKAVPKGPGLAGVAVDAVFDSVSVGTTFQSKLAEMGIIFGYAY